MWKSGVLAGLMVVSMCLGVPYHQNPLGSPGAGEGYTCGQHKSSETSGNVSGPGEFPWLVQVFTVSKRHARPCDGTLIHRQAVLVPAHCIKDEPMKIVAGVWDRNNVSSEYNARQERNVSVKIIHENYEAINLHNNFGILILSEPVDLTENIGVVCLPEEDSNGADCVASGWSYHRVTREFGNPRKIQPSSISDEACQTLLLSGVPSVYLDPSLFCTYGKPSMNECKGTSGTPLVCPVENNPSQYYQVGFVSWLARCAMENYPTVWSDVRGARKWIDAKLAEHLG